MADDSIDIQVTPEKAELKGVHPRRYSTGNLSLAKGVVDVSPRYLGASVTSCHDLCKYGIKHDPGEKPWLRKSKRNPTRLGEQNDLVKDVLTSIAEGKKKPVIKNESPKKVAVSSPHPPPSSTKQASGLRPKSLARASSVPGDLKSRKYSKVTGSLETSSPGDLSSTKKRNPGTNKQNPGKVSGFSSTDKKSVRKASGENPTGEDVQPLTPLAENKKLKQVKNSTRTSLLSALSLSPRRTSLRPTKNEPPSVNLHARTIKNAESDGISDGSGAGVENQTDDCEVKNIDSLQDPIPSSSPGEENLEKSENGTDSSQLHPSPETKKLRRTKNGSQTSLLSKSPSLKKILTPVRKGSSSSSSTPSLKLRTRLPLRSSGSNSVSESENKGTNQVKSSSRARRVKIVSLEEKVRAPKKLGTRLGKSSSPSQVSSSPSEVASSQSTKNVEVDPKSENLTPDPQVKRAGNRLRRGRQAGLEDEGGSPKKLHFRRGKVIDIQPKNVIPRILKFKQRVLLGENQSGRGDAWRRTMKKLVGGDESNGFSSGGVKVALRHQSVEGKKEDKSLFNNVIEETATLLAQTRKSKVKALVGAFETVISLQDKKKLKPSNST